MKYINDLLAKMKKQLEQRNQVPQTSNRPAYPTAIFYAGEESLEAQMEIQIKLRQLWRARADAIRHFRMDGGAFTPCQWQVPSKKSMSREETVGAIEEIIGRDDCFDNCSKICLILVQHTAQYRSLEDFTRDYFALDDLAEVFKQSQTMKLVFLDERISNREVAGQIKAYLHNETKNGNPKCKTTVVLSNHLRSGKILTGKQMEENYELAANIILLTNGCSNSFSPVYSDLFNPRTLGLVTAAYSKISRPNQQICEVMVNTMLEWMGQCVEKKEGLNAGEIGNRLQITGGAMKAIADSYKRNVSDKIPSREILERLPRMSSDMSPIGGLPFERFDAVTANSFPVFFADNVEPECSNPSVRDQFRQEFRQFVQGAFTPQEAACSLTSQTVDAVLAEINTDMPAPNQPAYGYMCRMAEVKYTKLLIPVCREVLLQISQEASAYITQLRKLMDDFNMGYMLNVDETVANCYGPIVRNCLEGEHGTRFLRWMNSVKPEGEKLLEQMYGTLQDIISTDPIFTMSLPDELTRRLNGNRNALRALIRQELTEKLSDRIRLRTPVIPDKQIDTVMLDLKSDVFNFLQDSYPNMITMDTGDNSVVELLQFYRIGLAVI